jgi:hypothetical protein
MASVVAVFGLYLWVGLLHAWLVGSTAFLWWGRRLAALPAWLPTVGMGLVLAFFELYWKPIFAALGISVFIDDAAVHAFFGIDARTDLVAALRSGWFNWVFIGLQALLAYRLGRRGYERARGG